MTATADRRLIEHVDRIEAEHPPVPLASVDFTVLRPDVVRERFGPTLDYLARVELEVDRNVLELNTMLANPPEVDVRFYREVWHAQEIQHGLILDTLQTIIGRPPATTDTHSVSAKMKILGALSHLSPVQDIVRMLYYLTGMSTERSAVLAYNHLHAGLAEMGENALAETVVTPIRRQDRRTTRSTGCPRSAWPPSWRPGRSGSPAACGPCRGGRSAPTTAGRRPTSEG
jgi:hypothetical protein